METEGFNQVQRLPGKRQQSFNGNRGFQIGSETPWKKRQQSFNGNRGFQIGSETSWKRQCSFNGNSFIYT